MGQEQYQMLTDTSFTYDPQIYEDISLLYR